nr:DUF4276 family protein [Quadrisphaera sp. DSM 44207]
MVVYGEGPSDPDFFPPVLSRSLEALLFDHVQASSSMDLRVNLVPNGQEPRGARIAAAVQKDHPDAVIVALHFDATANPNRQRRQVFDPVEAEWPAGPGTPVLVPLAPRREMEAWALADLDTLRGVVGVRLDTSTVFEGHLLGSAEQLSEPKRTLAELVAQAVRPRRRAPRAADYLPYIAENLPLSSLRRLPSFQAFEESLVHALTELGWTSYA